MRDLAAMLALWMGGATAALGAPAASSGFIVYKVGAGADCPYQAVQDAIDAAAAHPGTDLVWIAADQSYAGQHLVVTDQDLEIVGGFTDCDDIDPGLELTTLRGGDGHSVLEIEGTSHVFLSNLVLTGATMDSSHRGGGIYFGGQGALELSRTTVSFNEAGYGAGIDLNGGTGPATLTLDAESLILSNTASVSGGGIRIEGQARLFALQPRTLIAYNKAPNGYGGGIEVVGPGLADIGSPGYNGVPVVFDNSAAYGGGIDAYAVGDHQNATVRVFTTDPEHPTAISGNTAAQTGGGIYLKPLDDIDFSVASAVFCAYDFRIEDNIAQEGTAIYADDAQAGGVISGIGGSVFLNARAANGLCATPDSPALLGAVRCAADVPCNRIALNTALDPGGNPTGGSTILLQTAATFVADRIDVSESRGGHALRMLGDDDFAVFYLTDCLIADNALTGEVIARTDGDEGLMVIDSCTIARNDFPEAATLLAPGADFYLLNTIVDQPGHATVDPPVTNAAYIMSNEIASLPQRPDVVVGTPSFVDATHGDFHLRPESPGIDFAPVESSERAHPFDLDGRNRVVDLWDTPTEFGPMDLGAYEIQLDQIFPCARDDTIYCDGFEGE
jgi:hypothetical protein